MNRSGISAGLLLRNDGGLGMPGGSSGVASLMAVSTSTAAPSILRVRSNCRVIAVAPSWLTEVIESRPAMAVDWRSSGVATAEAMGEWSPAGERALTLGGRNSTLGRLPAGRAL